MKAPTNSRNLFLVFTFFSIGIVFAACWNESANLRWLPDSSPARWKSVENQFAGFGRTMMEVGYRYSELYWAGEDQNWGYAEHHVEEIEETLELGLERRPERAESAKAFFPVLERVESAIEARNQGEFRAAFQALTASCNTCHHAENMSFIHIEPPKVRVSPVFAPPQQ